MMSVEMRTRCLHRTYRAYRSASCVLRVTPAPVTGIDATLWMCIRIMLRFLLSFCVKSHL